MIKECARCGIEFNSVQGEYYCSDCKSLHKLEIHQAYARKAWARRHLSKGDGVTIQGVLNLAPLYGCKNYDYGKISIARKVG